MSLGIEDNDNDKTKLIAADDSKENVRLVSYIVAFKC